MYLYHMRSVGWPYIISDFHEIKKLLNKIFYPDITNIIIQFNQTTCWDDDCDFDLCISRHSQTTTKSVMTIHI